MNGSVLLVIGDDEQRLHLRRALSGEGWRVIPSGSGAQAGLMAERAGLEVEVGGHRLPHGRGFPVVCGGPGPDG